MPQITGYRGVFPRAMALACIASLFYAPLALDAQQQSSTTGQGTNSPGGGITGGSSSIESTLFAYRSLASDVDAVASEIGRLVKDQKVVVGMPVDVAAFSQWRAIMSQAFVLNNRAMQIHDAFPDPTAFHDPIPLPPAHLTAAVGTTGNDQSYNVTITVSNGPSPQSGPTNGTITVQLNLGTDFTFTAVPGLYDMTGKWTCDQNMFKCTTSDTIAPDTTYQASITAKLTRNNQHPRSTFTVKVSGGGSKDYSLDTVLPPAPPATTAALKSRLNDLLGTPQAEAAARQHGLTADEWDAAVKDFQSRRQLILDPKTAVVLNSLKPDTANAARAAGLSVEHAQAFAETVTATADAASTAPPPAAAAAPAGAGAALGIAGTVISTVSQLFALVAQITSVTQTLSPSQVTIQDTPLINMTAGRLQHYGVSVYVPSVYTANLYRNGDLKDTFLWKALWRLETDRVLLVTDIADAAGNYNRANFVVQNAAKYKPDDVFFALQYTGTIQSLLASAQAIASNIDSFESGLFGGQPAPQSSSNPTQQSQQGQTNQQQGQGSNQPSNQTAQSSNQSSQSSNQSSQQSQNSQQSPTTSTSSQASNIITQLLAADLLAQRLWTPNGQSDYQWIDKDNWEKDFVQTFEKELRTIHFLTVKALEAGGSQLNKTNFFYGTHIFFSGGAAMTFGLYNVTGEVSCSGVAYNYEGNVREKNYDRALRLGQVPAIVRTDFGCEPATAELGTVRLGMTATEVENALGVPNHTVRVKGGAYTYDFGNLRIVFKNGLVYRVTARPPRKGMTRAEVAAFYGVSPGGCTADTCEYPGGARVTFKDDRAVKFRQP